MEAFSRWGSRRSLLLSCITLVYLVLKSTIAYAQLTHSEAASAPSVPSCGTDQQTTMNRRIGYYEGWAANRSCLAFTPEQIPASSLTHVNFAYAYISSNFEVIPMNPGDEKLWSRTTNLKSNAPLKVFLSIGGWAFNNPPTQRIFSDLAASSTHTRAFILSVLRVLETYGFDGIDIDWEYPGASDRGGVAADSKNYVNFMKAIKAEFLPLEYGLTFTAPSSSFYLKHFDLAGLLRYADWVNIMTYDLHGVWDGVDPSTQFVLEAHSNLTKIDEAFRLFWRAGVDPSQMVMGVSFYGRSFTLADPDCVEPPCSWVSGGEAGPCSDTSGTLMSSEIATVLQSPSVQQISDQASAVNYAIWNSNQWVSYDDADTFASKINFANDHCIGGLMIWSIDQDDASYTALSNLYPGLLGFVPDIDNTGNECVVSPCGAKSCGLGQVSIASVWSNPAVPGLLCDINRPALLCCPPSDAPRSCTWRSGKNSVCNPSCNANEIVLATYPVGGAYPFQCLQGEQALCCDSNLNLPAFGCKFSECTSSPTCPAKPNGSQHLVTVGTRGQGSPQSASCISGVNTGLEKQCPDTCPPGKVKPFCCSDKLPYQNCDWVGTPPLCLDNTCAVGQIELLTDPQGNSSQPCIGGANKVYCCDPAGSNFVPIPFDYIFPSNVSSGSESLTVDIDQDMGSSKSGSAKAIVINQPTNINGPPEESQAFGEVFIDSPNPASVSSLSIESDWVIVGCNSTSDQPQQLLAYCSKEMDNPSSGCRHVFIGQAKHTIVKMPRNCGKGPYARIDSLEVHPDQNILPAYHASVKPSSEAVYSLHIDYNFLDIPISNGPVHMRASDFQTYLIFFKHTLKVDVSDLPDYWDNIVDSPPERREWLQRRGLWKEKTHTKRWWGAFTRWLKKITTVTLKSDTSREFIWSDTYTIFSQRKSCPGPPAFESSMDISVSGSAEFRARYGFYLQGQIVPPNVDSAYLYFSSNANALAKFTITGSATVSYESNRLKLASFGFPGLYYPGILTIGPSLVLEGYITGQLSIGGVFEASLSYDFPSVDFKLGNSGSDQIPKALSPSSPPSTQPVPKINWEVDLHGDLSIHVVPQVQMGISILGGVLIDAQAFIRADLGAGVSIDGSVSSEDAAKICINPYFEVDLDAGLTGSLLFWKTAEVVWPIYQNRFNFPKGGYCHSPFESREINRDNGIWLLNSTEPLLSLPNNRQGAYIRETADNGVERIIKPVISQNLSLQKRGIPFLPGSLFCPAKGKQIAKADNNTATDFDPYDDLSTVTTLEDAFERRELDEDIEDIQGINISDIHSFRRVSVAACSGSSNKIIIHVPPYSTTKPLGYFDLKTPGSISINSDYGIKKNPQSSTANVYAREHVYEAQMLSLFINELSTMNNLWKSSTYKTFCPWAKKYLSTPYFPGKRKGTLSVVDSLERCLPAGSAKNTDLRFPAGNKMVFLENIANGAKALAIAGKNVRSKSKFLSYTATKQIAVFRATAGVISYMDSGIAFSQFRMTHKCVNKVWIQWFERYSKDRRLPAAVKTRLTGIAWTNPLKNVYTDWIDELLDDFQDNLKRDLQSMATWYNPKASTVVTLNYAGNLRTASPKGTKKKITKAIVQKEAGRVNRLKINWISKLN